MAVNSRPNPDDRTVASTPAAKAKTTPDLALVPDAHDSLEADVHAPAQSGKSTRPGESTPASESTQAGESTRASGSTPAGESTRFGDATDVGEPADREQDILGGPTSAGANSPSMPQRALTVVPVEAESFTRRAGAVEPGGMYDAVTRPRLASVRGDDEHYLPATARYADQLTEGALALRHQAIIRLGVTSAPRPITLHTTDDARIPNSAEPESSGARTADDAEDEVLDPQAASKSSEVARREEPAARTSVSGMTGAAQAGAAYTGGVEAETSSAQAGVAYTGGVETETSPAQAGAANAGGVEAGNSASKLSVAVGEVRGARAGAVSGRSDRDRTPLKSAPTSTSGGAQVGREELPGLPDARLWGGRLAQAVSEVLVGDRPISQLVRFTDDQVFLELNRRVRLLGLNSTAGTRGAKEKSTVRSVRVFMPQPAIAEVAAHVRHGQRSRAVALRLEIRRNRWICTALELD
ncbi:hypothetical protein GCM10009630_50520 [Kribbella jejuensis]|uniref:Uncharacterized protein n=1 Tax=Kribbella jejuensis TaxID=236068 RepID=A0A542E8T0_9ACTN|nr:Rv3235 family protein [Kribbella jejuensis]TQJ11741.1 hypothetical protein FB475_4664 [Kribbella jejuensis]